MKKEFDSKDRLLRSKKFLKEWNKLRGHVYNYPDLFEFFYPNQRYNQKEIEKIWSNFIKTKKKQNKIDLYLNIPFCFKKCAYCISGSEKLKNRKQLENYIDLLTKQIDNFKDIFSKIEFTNLYLGGGTPSILSEKMLDKLLTKVFSTFNFSKQEQRTCEFNPINCSLNKLTLLKKKFGFNRISFGVQSLDKKILELNNRSYQTYKLVRQVTDQAKKTGYEYINIDLIIGLCGDNKESFLKTFKQVFKLKANSISLYPLQPTNYYLDKFFNSNTQKFIDFSKNLINSVRKEIKNILKESDWVSKQDLNDYINEAFLKNGSWVFVRKNFKEPNNFYAVEAGNSILGLGDKGTSIIKLLGRYQAELKKNKFSYFGTCQNKDAQMLYYLGDKLFTQRFVSKKDFKFNFKKDFLKEFKKSLKQLKKLKVIKVVSQDKVFFNEEKITKLFLYFLFFLGEKNGIINNYKKMTQKTKTQKAKNKKDNLSENILDGIIEKKLKKSLDLMIKDSNKKRKLFITPETKYIKLTIDLTSRETKEIKLNPSEIEIGDEVSLVLDEENKENIKEIRKIFVSE